ncbi:MAG: ABC transporter ATP-binding protein [Acidobacteria bacterium]|nr:ABC transporter ATP-binding protein [Acidobacteriota bacterium]
MSLHTVSESALGNNLALRLEGISVRYRIPHERYATLREHAIRWLKRHIRYDDYLALRDISLRVHKGEMLGIIGPNGAGKSTLLKVVARVLKPKKGTVWICGRVAPLLECGAGFHTELTGRENIYLNGTLLGLSRKEIESRYQGIVDFAELRDFIDAPLRTYSSGMVSRLGFAIATDANADILIIDEVLAVGDVSFQEKSLERIKRFRRDGTTILFVSHNMEAVKSMCDKVIWLDHGVIKADGSASEVVRQYLSGDLAGS